MVSKLLFACILALSSLESNIPTYLYIILPKDAWQESLQSLGRKDDFIHLATDEQISHVAEKFFKGIDYVVLKIETQKMRGRLVYETNPRGSNKYYHLYEGAIPLEAVVEVINK